jgi:hypothetical protein|tara:strand:+ start:1710 stop:2087 length:378 start_codon:yes stop_codon:yes gene_type:complete
MINIILSFLIGCTFMYLLTVVSSALKAATVLEDAMLTYAILLMSAYEVSLKQLEMVIVAGQIPQPQAEVLRQVNKKEFETFANTKIEEILKTIPVAHTNIIRYNNFSEMKLYITKQYRSKYAKSN